MTARIPLGRVGEPDEVAALDLLARERGDVLLDRRLLRHLRRTGDVLIRFVRARTDEGRAARRTRRGRRSSSCSTTTTRSRRCAAKARSRASIRSRRSSCCRRSTHPRSGAPASRTSAAATRALEEAQTDARDVYALVYDADRPELFLKDAAMRRTVGPGGSIRVRSDSRWNGARAGARPRARRGRRRRSR